MVLVLLTSLRSFSSFWHGIARKRSLLVLRASVAIKSTEKAATMSRVFCTFFPQKVPIAVCDWCCLPLFGRLLTAVFARGVLCTFWPQKVPKTLRQMPSPTLGGLTLAPGDYSRVCKQTAPSARAFRPPCVSRLRHRVGISLRLWRREADAITPFRKNYEKLRIYQTYPLRLISANVARTQAARSEGATLSCRPRTPALT